jgi:hypothetical protein
MSQDFVLFRAPPGGRLVDLITGAMSETVGEISEVQAAIRAVLPGIEWQLLTEPLDESLQIAAWFGQHDGNSEIQLMVEPDGQVRMIHMSETNRAEVETVTHALGLVAFDEKSLEVLGGYPERRSATA